MRSSAQDALERGVPPYPYFYPFDCEGSGASLGLVPDEVSVPGCFGTNRKVYKCLGHKSLSLHHGRLLDGPLSFRTTGHCKYRFWSCMTFFAWPWRDLCRHGNPWDRSQSFVEDMADFRGRRHLEFLIWLLIGWNLWRPSWIWKTIASIVLNSAPDWLKFVAAILDVENNSVHCSPNNSLLSFSAPDWLPHIWASYTTVADWMLRKTLNFSRPFESHTKENLG